MVAKAKVRIEGEDATAAAWNSALQRGKKAADQTAGAWRAAFGGISIAVVANFARQQAEMADALANGAKYAGMQGREFSTLAYAAKLADVEVTDLSTSLKKMQVTISQAASGSKGQIETLEAIGLSAEKLKGLDADEQLELIADGVRRLGDEEDRTRALTEIFGKSGANLKPMFEEGAEGIRKAREEAERIGYAFSDEQLSKMQKMDDSIKRMTASWDAFATTLVSKVASPLSWTMDRLSGLPKDVNEQIADQEDLIERLKHMRGPNVPEQRAAAQARLQQLRELSLQQSMRDMGVGGGAAPAVPGFGTGGSGTAAAERERLQLQEANSDRIAREAMEAQQAFAEMNQALDDSAGRLADSVEDHFDNVGDALEDLEIDQEQKLSEMGQLWKDTFMNGWDDWVNNGKQGVDELLEYWLAQVARRGMSNLLDTALGAIGSSGNMGWLSAIFGGTRDSGGRGNPGQVYAIGKGAQPELFVPDSAGTFVPRGMGGTSVHVQQTIINQNPTADFIKEFPKVLKKSNEALKADIIDGLQRGRYAI